LTAVNVSVSLTTLIGTPHTELGCEAKVEICPALGLNGSYADFQKLLAKYADRESLL
jgi:hypothetical protein